MHEFKKLLKILERGETHKGRNKEPTPETKKIFTNKKNNLRTINRLYFYSCLIDHFSQFTFFTKFLLYNI